ncbi:MAG: hypothetical protein OXH19_01020 [Chloroflexi bacterium]|nr:hypothetical protein [Chloroflexota bacterium]MCY3587713.1 hypothetical protein [Chloroflexota bacterium]MCY3685205.1 hypothetical protein [Chloroflexota bacterium]MDE2707859.1 hypothetical protein [Chloroflexota bacterium]
MSDSEAASAAQTGRQTTQQLVRNELRRRLAEEALTAAAEQVEALLREAALELRPFPPFPGAFFTMGVEVEPDGVRDKNIGCVIVTEEGALRELQLSFDDEGPAVFLGANDPVSMRDETLAELEDVSAQDRLTLAMNGLDAVSDLLENQPQ